MKVQSSAISMNSTYVQSSYQSVKESLSISNNHASENRFLKGNGNEKRLAADEKNISNKILKPFNKTSKRLDKVADKIAALDDGKEQNDSNLDPKLRVIKFLLEKLTGKKIDVFDDFDKIQKAMEKNNPTPPAKVANPQNNPGAAIDYNREEYYYASQYLNFQASGILKTKDGAEINFSLNFEMSREFMAYNNINISSGAAKDPLVINFDGNAAQLSDQKFSFDLNIDGANEQVPYLKPGSGFLVFDKNKDGMINNGSELFGTKTGNGFNELSAYDNDQNGWIDESDPVYNDLGIWHKNNSGDDEISSLRKKSIGAIYLDRKETPFEIMNNNNNEKLGETASTGIFLKDNGTAGSIQQLNLVI